MICTVCYDMLNLQKGRLCKGTLDLQFEHHTNGDEFLESVRWSCAICRALYISLLAQSDSQATYEDNLDLPRTDCSSLTSKASLSVIQAGQLYCLKIILWQAERRIQHEFHLKAQSRASICPNRHSAHVVYTDSTAISSRTITESPHLMVVEKAMQWLRNSDECLRWSVRSHPFYPARLISLEKLHAWLNRPDDTVSPNKVTEMCVHLIETQSWFQPDSRGPGYSGRNKLYVTLSHCWGQTVNEHQKLRSVNYKAFLNEIPVCNLPNTFQDAILFAARLPDVGYIWIDSLCIIQDNKEDWACQSADMGRIYSETYLNLSATSATNSDGGLVKNPSFKILEEEEVLVNIQGLPGAYNTDLSDFETAIEPSGHVHRQRCTILDETFWTEQVDRGAVNSRAWVLQERLLSPRVMHFCQYQVGWECCDFANDKSPNDDGPLRDVGSEEMAGRGVVKRLRKKTRPSNGVTTVRSRASSSIFEMWAGIVNTYTKTALTKPQDKLVALSGLARVLDVETQCGYVAGLWETDLASQLLWYVEPAFNHSDRSFSHPATFPDEYRAPSFSWAAIDVIGHGVTFAHAVHRHLFIHVEQVRIPSESDRSKIVTEASIVLWGALRAARLVSQDHGRFGWYLVNRGALDKECHTNVYLDCPQRDADQIDSRDAQVFVLPVAKDDAFAGTSRNEYLLCLLLRYERRSDTFRRIGMTKLSPSRDRRAMHRDGNEGGVEYKILERWPGDVAFPHNGYNAECGTHRIRLV